MTNIELQIRVETGLCHQLCCLELLTDFADVNNNNNNGYFKCYFSREHIALSLRKTV